ncbi:hypothetical protein PSCLAVI8L_130319 [Pseudoclavibacter sp. 8L]|nr:hypothetical protein PSCLAVI8L_130319 [Pseudoclavibacter sp. 8L]
MLRDSSIDKPFLVIAAWQES